LNKESEEKSKRTKLPGFNADCSFLSDHSYYRHDSSKYDLNNAIGLQRAGRRMSSVGAGRRMSSVGAGRRMSSVGAGRRMSSVGAGRRMSSVGAKTSRKHQR
jgi:hypothetical protein